MWRNLKNTQGLTFSSLRYRIYRLNAGVVSDDILPAHGLVGVIGGNTVQITAQCSVPVLFKARIDYTTFVLNITVPFPTSDEKEKIAVKSCLRIPGNSCTRFTTAQVKTQLQPIRDLYSYVIKMEFLENLMQSLEI